MGSNLSTSMHNSIHYIGRLQGVSVMTNAPDLYEFALVGSWSKLLARLSTHPHEAKWSDKCKNTALHLVCRRQPPLDVVLALIRSNPVSPTLLTVDGLTPLHFACYCGASPDVVSVLIRTNENAVTHAEKRGKTPLHCTCAGFRSSTREKVLKMLLEYNASAAILADEKGRTPVSLIFDDYAEEIEEERLVAKSESTENLITIDENTNVNQQKPEVPLKKMLTSKQLKECYRLISLLLRAAYHQSILNPPPDSDKFRILHAAVGTVACPPQFIKILTHLSPGDERDFDLQGKLPLHVAASTIIFEESTPPIDFGSCEEPITNNQRILDSCAIIQHLLLLYAEAASIRDINGKIPLLLAIEAGKPWDGGLYDLINATTKGLEEKVIIETMLRAMSSKSQNIRNETVKTCSNIVCIFSKENTVYFISMLKDCITKIDLQTDNEDDVVGIKIGMLKALHGLLQKAKQNMKNTGLQTPQDNNVPNDFHDNLQHILQLCSEMSIYPDDKLRENAGKVIGAVCDLTGVEAATDLLSTIVKSKPETFAEKKQIHIYTCYGILTADVGLQIVQGGLDVFQQTRCDEIFDSLQHLFKSFLVDEDANIRKSASLAIGAVLGRSNCASSCLKELKGSIIKCMRTTEHSEIHVNLARGLTVACKMNPNIFRGKPALPILDAALMLAVSGPRRVQNAFNKFLYVALSVKDFDVSEELEEYMNISEGENGRIMMTLVAKTLKRLVGFDEDEII